MGSFGSNNKPIWTKAGLSALSALNYVKACEDQDELLQIVLNGKLDQYKEEALKKIKDKAVLKDLAKKLDDNNLAIKALLYAEDEAGLKELVSKTDFTSSMCLAIDGIHDEDFLFEFAKANEKNSDVLTACVKKINHQAYLSELGKKWNPFAACVIAEKTEDVALLKHIVSSYSDEPPHPGQFYPLVQAENKAHETAQKRLDALKS